MALLRYDLLAALEEVVVDGQVLQSTMLDPQAGPAAYVDACRFYSALDSARRLALLVCSATAAGSQVRATPKKPTPQPQSP